MNPCITVVMPAYNAQATIETALKSIRMQTVADQIEILVIDGGSTDATREIALRYGAAVLDNPRRLPEPAKQIG
ncbi:MAG: glycosyltransferase family 2 protein, partial [Gemmiger sp.]